MNDKPSKHGPIGRGLPHLLVVVAGLLSIIGSGGGFFPDTGIGGCCLTPSVDVLPSSRIVAVGERVTFEARAIFATAPVRYRWHRNGVEIAGASAPTYTLPGANLADDGAQFSVLVDAANGSASASATLLVSPGPPLVFQDADFAVDAWTVSVVTEPATSGPTLAVAQAASGGDPGAYRALRYDMTAGASGLRAYHLAASATHDPATQGAIYGIDFSASCIKTGGGQVDVALLVEQGGRRFGSTSWGCSIAWMKVFDQGALRALNFRQLDGPPCGNNPDCLDFGPRGAPLRLGLFTSAAQPAGAPAVTMTQGVDNWRVAVWRR